MGAPSLLIALNDATLGAELAKLLAADGFDVDVVSSAAGAQNQAEEKAYQVVILDEVVEAVRGPELYERIERAQEEIEGILCAENPTLETVQIALDFGMKRVVAKPIDAAEIRSLVREAARNAAPRTARADGPVP